MLGSRVGVGVCVGRVIVDQSFMPESETDDF